MWTVAARGRGNVGAVLGGGQWIWCGVHHFKGVRRGVLQRRGLIPSTGGRGLIPGTGRGGLIPGTGGGGIAGLRLLHQIVWHWIHGMGAWIGHRLRY